MTFQVFGHFKSALVLKGLLILDFISINKVHSIFIPNFCGFFKKVYINVKGHIY